MQVFTELGVYLIDDKPDQLQITDADTATQVFVVDQVPPPEVLESANGREVFVLNNRGLRGFSAYEVALQNGFIGTQAEWLNSLKPATYIEGVITEGSTPPSPGIWITIPAS